MTHTPPATLKLPITPGRYACSVPDTEIHVHRIEGDIVHARIYRVSNAHFDWEGTYDWWRADGSCPGLPGIPHCITERIGDLPGEAPKPDSQPEPKPQPDPGIHIMPTSDLRERLLVAAFSGPLAGQLLESCEGDPAAAMRRLRVMIHAAINGGF